MRKNTRLSMPAQLQCLRSRVWDPGNEATAVRKTFVRGKAHILFVNALVPDMGA